MVIFLIAYDIAIEYLELDPSDTLVATVIVFSIAILIGFKLGNIPSLLELQEPLRAVFTIIDEPKSSVSNNEHA